MKNKYKPIIRTKKKLIETKNYLLKLSIKDKILRLIGLIGTLASLYLFIKSPSWPTPDKILVVFTFTSMIFGQAKQMLKRFLPFVVLLLVYESFRGLVPNLNNRVNYMWMPEVDRFLFGTLPTVWLQKYLWHGYIQWYDFVFYLFYTLHFILPLCLGLIIWKRKDSFYWQYVTSYVALSFSGFLTYLVFPAAPPWMASKDGLIEPITRVSSNVWHALGIHDFPSVYNKISPNPVAAVPSLHAAYATLFVIIIYKLFGKNKALLASIYPLMIYIGTVYQGEHYAIDAILGIFYAFVAFFAVDYFFNYLKRRKSK